MRWLNWRRATALLAIVVGIGVGTAVPANASTAHHVQQIRTSDFWW
jgi:hypothetical protein